MKTSKHSCFVCVKDAQERRELIEFTTFTLGIDGGFKGACDDYAIGEYVYTHNGCTYCVADLLDIPEECIDCGDNTELFKAIAAINDKDRLHQWHIASCFMMFKKLKGCVQTESGNKSIKAGEWYKVLSQDIAFKFIGNFKWIEATPEELIEHFKNK